MKKSLLVSIAVLAGTLCATLTSTITKVEAKAVATYEENIKPIKVTADKAVYQNYVIGNMLDGDESTYTWFNGRPREIVFDYGKVFLLNDIFFAHGKAVEGGGDWADTCTAEYSVDQTTWTALPDFVEITGETARERIELWDNPVEARYIRLVNKVEGGWIAIKEFAVNTLDAKVTLQNINLESVASNTKGFLDIYNINDDDNLTATWFGNTKTPEAAIILSYLEPREISFIELLMAKQGSWYDSMNGVDFYYSIDETLDENTTWTQIGESNNRGETVHLNLETPITVKHVKAQANGTNTYGLIVREFSTATKCPIILENSYEATGIRVDHNPVALNSIRNITDGNLETHTDIVPVDNNSARGVIYDLGSVKVINNVTIVTNAPWGDTLSSNAGKLLSSLDGNTWTDITDQFAVNTETNTYTLVDANLIGRYVKIETYIGWFGLTEFSVEATGELNASLGGAYTDTLDSSKFGLRFLIPVLPGTDLANYKAVAKTPKQEVTFNYGTNLVEVAGGLQLTLSLGDILNKFNRLTTEFTVTGYYNDLSVGEITYSVESIVRSYLHFNLVGKVSLTNEQVDFLTKLNNHIQSQDLCYEKTAPTVRFNFEPGTVYYTDSTERPTVLVSDYADYVVTYSSDSTGYNSTEFPTEPGTYSMVITINESDRYTSSKVYQWFKLSLPKVEPEITFGFSNQTVFIIGSEEVPTVTYPEDSNATVHYSGETIDGVAYLSEAFPTEPGSYSMVVTVEESEIYSAKKIWGTFKLRYQPTVTFSGDTAYTYDGQPHTPSYEVESGFEYTIHYNANGVITTEAPTEVGWYSLVVTVKGNGTTHADYSTYIVFHIDAAE